MIERNIGHTLVAIVRRWRSNHLWLLSLGLFALIRRAPRELGSWLQARAQELQTTLAALLLGTFTSDVTHAASHYESRSPVLLPPPGRGASLPPTSAPAGFTSGVMSRIRALPTPVAAPASQPIAAIWSAPTEPATDMSLLTPLGLFLAAGATLVVGMVAGCLIALANPSFETIVLSLVVTALILMLSALQVVAQTLNVVATNMWVAVPMLVTLLCVVLLAWTQIARLVGSQTVEI